MLMLGREGGKEYRFGFNGMESDNEILDHKSAYTAEFWQYDSRLGRRWNNDPVAKYHESPYTTFANNPIIHTDPLGNDTISIIGKNGNSWQFIHNSFDKRTINAPGEINGNQTFNFNEKNASVPDAIGYTISINGEAHAGPLAGGGAISFSNFLIFTRGDYAFQPFRYGFGAISGGLDITAEDANISASATISPFMAKFYGDIKNLTPQSWTGAFQDYSISAAGMFGIKGGLGISGFHSPGFFNEDFDDWAGLGLDVSFGIGVGTDAGAGTSLSFMSGKSQYFLLERHPTPTLKLTNSNIGIARMALKWKDFMNGGIDLGTFQSDVLRDVEIATEKLTKMYKSW